MTTTHETASPTKSGGCCSTASADSLTTVLNPVCGMKVDPATTAHHTTHDGAQYHFCSAGCLAKFTADPTKYLTNSPRAEPVAASGAMWTCPMHPEVRQHGPGTCPICGMALEPEEPSLDDAPNPELVDFTRRWWVSAALAVPLLILTMGSGTPLQERRGAPIVRAAPIVLLKGV